MENKKRFRYRLKDFNLSNPESKRIYNKKLFSPVSLVYSQVTRFLSFGRDSSWKERLIDLLPYKKGPKVLDIACGPGDLSFLMAKKYNGAEIIGIDLNSEMLSRAEENLRIRSPQSAERISFLYGDMNDLDFPDETFDFVTGGYALRNSPELKKSLEEIYRVLKPGGFAAFLEFSKSNCPFFQKAQLHLLSGWGKFWGLIFHRNPEVYGYIAESLRSFPDNVQFYTLLKEMGFIIYRYEPVLLRFLYLTIVKKPENIN